MLVKNHNSYRRKFLLEMHVNAPRALYCQHVQWHSSASPRIS